MEENNKNKDAITCETFRLNRNMEKEAELIEMLENSNNKSGLIKRCSGNVQGYDKSRTL